MLFEVISVSSAATSWTIFVPSFTGTAAAERIILDLASYALDYALIGNAPFLLVMLNSRNTVL